jgi:hypothetical protein
LWAYQRETTITTLMGLFASTIIIAEKTGNTMPGFDQISYSLSLCNVCGAPVAQK